MNYIKNFQSYKKSFKNYWYVKFYDNLYLDINALDSINFK